MFLAEWEHVIPEPTVPAEPQPRRRSIHPDVAGSDIAPAARGLTPKQDRSVLERADPVGWRGGIARNEILTTHQRQFRVITP